MKYQKRRRKITEFPPPLAPLDPDVIAALDDDAYQRSIERPAEEINIRRECGIGPPMLIPFNPKGYYKTAYTGDIEE